ncbi:MAG: SMC-Scp complex subunit ScpB [Bdellovibrionaceae bacterium]|nr:SMC-Scp complex subunit ScpB [Pseudobdellovibrionaceae bacterium]
MAKNSEGEILPEDFFESSDSESDEIEDVEIKTSIFLREEEEAEGFLPEVREEEADIVDKQNPEVLLEGTELDGFESAEIEDVEFVEDERLESIIESILFASDRPVSLASLKLVFKGTNISTAKIKRIIENLAVEYAGGRRGVTLEEAPGGYQLRTKVDNMEFMRRTLKTRPFKLSGPALEVLAIVAYKQPTVKAEVDEIRGVESGHLLRALMEKNLVTFEGKSELPGRPMQYGTTKKFLEIFGLRNLKELPTLSQIDELLPEGIGEEDETEKSTLSTITDSMAEIVGSSYSQGEEELMKITEQLEEITTSSEFFEKEKIRQREKRDQEKAQNIRDALTLGEVVSNRDINWLKRYDESLVAGQAMSMEPEEAPIEGRANEVQEAIVAFDAEDHDEDAEELPFLGEADDIDEEGPAQV